MKNNKLLKRFLMSTALGAISLSAVSDAMAVENIDANTGNVQTVAKMGPLVAPAVTVDYDFTTIHANQGLEINHLIANGKIGTITSSAAPVAGSFANIIVKHNAAGQQYTIDHLNGAVAATIFKFTQDNAADSLTIKKVSGTNSTVLVHGDKTNIILGATTNADFHQAKTFQTDGYDAAKLTIVGKSKALGTAAGEGYFAKQGTITIQNDSEGRYEVADAANADKTGVILFDAKDNDIVAKGDATLKSDSALLIFGSSAAAKARNITFEGKVNDGATKNGMVILASKDAVVNLTMKEEIKVSSVIVGHGALTDAKAAAAAAAAAGAASELDAALGVVLAAAGNTATSSTTLTLQNNSEATNYSYSQYGTLVLDSANANVSHKGTFAGKDANSVLKTTGANKVTITGTINDGILEVGAQTNVTGAIGNNNLVAIKFDKDVKGGLLQAQAGIGKAAVPARGGAAAVPAVVGATVDFAKTGSVLEISGADGILGAITNVAGSTIKMTSDHNLTLGVAGAAGELLNVDASKITANTAVSVVDKSFFDVIDTGAGRLVAGGTINANEIKGGSIDVNGADLIIKANGDNKIAINSKKVEFSTDNALTIDGDFTDFNTNVTKLAGGGGANNKLTFTGSGTIKSGTIGANGATIAELNIGSDKKTVTLDTKGEKHYVDKLNFQSGTVKLASDYNNKGVLIVANGGTVDLGNSTLKNDANITLDGANIILTGDDKKNGKIEGNILAAANSVNIKIADEATFTSVVIADHTADMALEADQIKLAESKNKFATDSFSFKNDAGAVVTGANAGKTLTVTRALDKTKFESFVKTNASTITGNFKKFNDGLLLEGVDKLTGDARLLVLEAGSNESKAVAHLASALPRNTVETQKNVLRANQTGLDAVTAVINSRAAGAAADDLKTNASIWAKGTFGKGTQEVSDIYVSGYDSTMFGGTIGAEFGLGESMTVGAAGSYTQTTLEYKGLRKDEDKFKSMYGSLYGFANFENNFILNAQMTFGSTSIEGKTVNVLTDISSDDDKVKSMSYGGSLLGGYKADFSSLSVTPLAGIGFYKFESPAVKTAGGKVSAKAYDSSRVDLIGGLSIAGEIKTESNMVIVPEIHGFGYYNVKDVEKQVTLDMQGLQNNTVSYLSTDTTKTNFTAGLSLTAKTAMVEYGASVDGQFADKYMGVIGSLKLKVNL